MVSNYEYDPLGGIWIVWSNKVKLKVECKMRQLISCLIKLDDATTDFLCMFVYASKSLEERRELWRDLKNHQNSALYRGKKWICLGDFNEILDPTEHSAPSTGNGALTGMVEFQEAVRFCSLMDMAHNGPKYTWCNKREAGLICKKLDHVLVNDIWLQQIDNSYCVYEARGCSDNLCCVISLLDSPYKPKCPFKVVNAVMKMEEFKLVVRDYWSSTEPIFSSTTALFHVSKKLKCLKPIIRNLGRKKIHQLSRRTEEAFVELCHSQEKTLRNLNSNTMSTESVSGLEEEFLKQWAKLH